MIPKTIFEEIKKNYCAMTYAYISVSRGCSANSVDTTINFISQKNEDIENGDTRNNEDGDTQQEIQEIDHNKTFTINSNDKTKLLI